MLSKQIGVTLAFKNMMIAKLYFWWFTHEWRLFNSVIFKFAYFVLLFAFNIEIF
jgi:hypothetical protein